MTSWQRLTSAWFLTRVASTGRSSAALNPLIQTLQPPNSLAHPVLAEGALRGRGTRRGQCPVRRPQNIPTVVPASIACALAPLLSLCYRSRGLIFYRHLPSQRCCQWLPDRGSITSPQCVCVHASASACVCERGGAPGGGRGRAGAGDGKEERREGGREGAKRGRQVGRGGAGPPVNASSVASETSRPSLPRLPFPTSTPNPSRVCPTRLSRPRSKCSEGGVDAGSDDRTRRPTIGCGSGQVVAGAGESAAVDGGILHRSIWLYYGGPICRCVFGHTGLGFGV